jgi:hypothetical protein
MKQLNILGYLYTLDSSKKLSDMGGNVGFCSFDLKELVVANDVESDVRESTLLHEVIEALNYHLELKLKHNQIMALEVGLHQVLKDAGVDLSVLEKEGVECQNSQKM